MTWNSVESLIYQSATTQRDFNNLEMRADKNLAKIYERWWVLHQGKKSLRHQTWWWFWWTSSWKWASNVLLLLRFILMRFFHAWDKILPAGQEKWSFPSPSYTWSRVSNSGPLSIREMWTYWKESKRGPPHCWRAWSTSPVRRVWKCWDCSAWRTRGSRRSRQCP